MERILSLAWDPRALRKGISLALVIWWSRLVLFGPTRLRCHRNNIDFSPSSRSSRAGPWLVVYILLHFLWITRLTTSKANGLTSPTLKLILRVLTFNLFSKRSGWSPLLLDIHDRRKLFGSEIIIIVLGWRLLRKPILIFRKILYNLRLTKRYVILWVIFVFLNFGVPVLLQQLVLIVIRLVRVRLLNMLEVIWIDVFRLYGLSLLWTHHRIFSIEGLEIIFRVWTISTPILHVGVI